MKVLISLDFSLCPLPLFRVCDVAVITPLTDVREADLLGDMKLWIVGREVIHLDLANKWVFAFVLTFSSPSLLADESLADVLLG